MRDDDHDGDADAEADHLRLAPTGSSEPPATE